MSPRAPSRSASLKRPPAEALAIPRTAWPTLVLAVVTLAGFAGAVAAGVSGALPVAVAVGLAALCDWVVFTLMHEASHGLLGRRRPVLNQAFGELFAVLLMCRFNGFRQVHQRHHRHTNEPGLDPDEWAGGGPTWQLPFRWATSDLNYWFQFNRDLRMPRVARVGSDLSLALFVLVLVGLLAAGFWRELLLYWVLPARLGLFASTWFFDYLPHQRPHGTPISVDPCRTSVIVRGGKVVDAVLLGHTMHLVHHLFPTVPWYRLSDLYRAIRPELLARGAREVYPWSLPRPDPAIPASTAG